MNKEDTADRGNRVRGYLEAAVAASKTPGIQYVVVDSAKILFEYHGGWADIGRHVRMDSATTMMAPG